MTLMEAFERIKQARPGLTFNIDCEMWHHDHGKSPAAETVEWSIYDAEQNRHFRATSLEGAVVSFLQPDGSREDASAAVGTIVGAAE